MIHFFNSSILQKYGLLRSDGDPASGGWRDRTGERSGGGGGERRGADSQDQRCVITDVDSNYVYRSWDNF